MRAALFTLSALAALALAMPGEKKDKTSSSSKHTSSSSSKHTSSSSSSSTKHTTSTSSSKLTTSTKTTSATPTITCMSYNDNFDNLTVNGLIPEADTFTYYGGLTYHDFVAATGLLPNLSVAGVMPHSQPNVAGNTLIQDVMEFGSTTLNPFGYISTSGTKTKYFDFSEFYFGCVILDATTGVPAGAEGCSISVVGYNYTGDQLEVASFNFAPTSLTDAPMVRAVLPSSYKGLVNATFGIATAAGAGASTVLELDNVQHCNY